MIPLNIYLREGSDAQVEHGIIEYGNAIKELISANIFPGDMLYKNFGVTRHGRVVFYDYDEIEYLTDCNVRQVPVARHEEDEMSSEPWYAVGPHDIFPQTYDTFLLGDERVRRHFMQHHADFFDPGLWQTHKDRILKGETLEYFPYDGALRFVRRYAQQFAGAAHDRSRSATPASPSPSIASSASGASGSATTGSHINTDTNVHA
jgi:isocitrate dehydrogenase kinase/phosphatase